jgi:hypothetical protein
MKVMTKAIVTAALTLVCFFFLSSFIVFIFFLLGIPKASMNKGDRDCHSGPDTGLFSFSYHVNYFFHFFFSLLGILKATNEGIYTFYYYVH